MIQGNTFVCASAQPGCVKQGLQMNEKHSSERIWFSVKPYKPGLKEQDK